MVALSGNTADGAGSTTSDNDGGLEIVGEGKQIKDAILLANKAAKSDITVLLEGESGVGKEVFAQYIHQNSKRASGPFVPVHCAAIPDSLFEAELFGFERGAFTNAFVSHRGYFEQGNGGTIFLDEISEIPLNFQVKLLRVLEEKHVIRLGGEQRTRIDVRFIVASQHSLQSLVKQGKFRQDLYYRVAVWVIPIPPLRMRKEDIKSLAHRFVSKNGGDGFVLSREAFTKLCHYDWPGNVRELESCIVRALIQSEGSNMIGSDDIQVEGMQWQDDDAERRQLEDALRNAGGSIKGAARILRVHRNTVYHRMKNFGIGLDRYRRSNTDQKERR